ncbi:unnamed protein product, partial [Ectocarpus fasciculatus]
MLDYLKGPISLHSKQQGCAPSELLELCDSACSKDKTSPPFSILHHAVRGGDADFVEVIVKSAAGGGVNTRWARGLVGLQDDKGETALHYAAKIGHTRIVRVLVEDGRSDMLAHSKRGALPIGLAIRAGHLSVAEYMLDYSHRNRQSFFDEKQPYSLMADAVGHPDILRALVHQCDIEIRVVPTKELIFKVATSGKTGAVDVLIEAGLDIETKRSEDASGPLHHAAKANNAEVVHALLRHGASVDAKDNAGQTPLHWAMKSGNLTSDKVSQIAKLLTESGSDVEAVDNNGDTPTRLARK